MDSGFHACGFRIPHSWIPDSITGWINNNNNALYLTILSEKIQWQYNIKKKNAGKITNNNRNNMLKTNSRFQNSIFSLYFVFTKIACSFLFFLLLSYIKQFLALPERIINIGAVSEVH